jgi:hypothetical protein
MASLPASDVENGFIRFPEVSDECLVVFEKWYGEGARAKTSGKKPVEVKAGKYDLLDVRIYRPDESGNVWSTRCILPDGLAVEKGETHEIEGVRGPEKAYVRVTEIGQNNYSMIFLMEDSNKNRYSYLRKNEKSIENPGFIMEDQEGKALMEGKFFPG